jgi:cobyrinic acid a,c-diamide synthase
VPSNEAAAAARVVESVRERVEQHVDLGRLLAIAASAARYPEAPAVSAAPAPAGRRLRVGIARDEAFAFYYADDLEAFDAAGAELVPIDMLRAPRLPQLDALVIGGGFPETQMRELEANEALRQDVARAIDEGLPVYAECGGLMYLARGISWQGETARMVGALPGDAVMHPRPVGRGYARLVGSGEPGWWPTAPEEGIPGHEFHYASLDNLAPELRYAWHVLRGHGVDGARDGIIRQNVLASFCHLRGAGEGGWVRPFVEFARRGGA